METFTIADLERDLAPAPQTFTVDDLNADLAGGPAPSPAPQSFTLEDLDRDLAGAPVPARTEQPGPFSDVYAPGDVSPAAPAAPSPAGYAPIPAPIIPGPGSGGPEEEPGLLSGYGGSARRGYKSLVQLRNLYGVSLGEDPAENIARIAELEKEKRSIKPTAAIKKFGEAKTFDTAFAAFLEAPLDVAGNLAVESLAQFFPGLGLAAGLGLAGGSVAGPPGQVAGMVVGVGGTSFLIEYGHKIFETIQEAGVDLTDPEQIKAAFANEKLMSEARSRAVRKGVPVAVFDAISGGIAGRILLAPVREGAKRTVLGTVGRSVAEIGVQSGLGATGEATGQLAEKGEIYSPADILGEAIAEIGPGAGEVAAGTLTGRRARGDQDPAGTPLRGEEAPAPTQAPPGPETPPPTPAGPEPAPEPGAGPAPAPPEAAPKTPAAFKATDENVKFVLGQVERGRFAGLSSGAKEWLAQNGTVEGPGAAPVLSERGKDLLGRLRAAVPPKPSPKASRAVPRTQAALERMLDRADAERNRGGFSAKVKAEARRLQEDALIELDKAGQRVLATDYGREWIASYEAARGGGLSDRKAANKADLEMERTDGPPPVEFTLRTARGAETHFRIPARPGALGALRERLAKKTAVGKFYAEGPTSPRETFTVEDLEADMAAPGPRAMPGGQYTGFVEDAAGADVAPEGEPIRREDILRPLTEALGAPLYQGRIGGKKRLGFYRPHLEEVRIKRASDIETAAHEMAHLLDDRIPEIRRQWNPATKANKEIREELRGVSYDRTKLYEGFAEFVRLWSTQKEEAKAKAPKFYGWFEDFLARSEYGPALRQSQADMHAWFAQDALLRAKSKIGVAEDINAGLQGTIGDRFRQSVADDLHGIFRMELDLTGEIAPVGAYETARLTRAAHSIAEGALTFGVPKVNADGSHIFVGKGLQQILEPVAKNLDDFLTYAVGRSARELRNQGRENLFTRAEVKAMVALETPAFKTAFQEYQGWNKGILDFAQAKGLIGGMDRAKWRRNEYIPFHRVGQPTAGETGTSGEWKGIKMLTGGTGNLKDILGNIIQNSVTLIDAALKNEARLEVARLAHKRGGARFMTSIPKEDKRIAIPTHEVRRVFLKAMGVRSTAQLPPKVRAYLDAAFEEMAPFAKFLMYGQAPYGDNVVAVLNRGKPMYFEVADPLLLRSLTHLNRPGRHWFVKLLNVPKRISQGTITLSFDFMGANLARDTLMGGIMSRHGFKPLLDSARGLNSRLNTDPAYKDFVANGGGFSSFLLDEDAMRRQMRRLSRFYKGKGIDYRTVLDAPDKILTALEHISSAVEMSTRIGEYRRAIGKGEHPRHAAYSGREVSVDFAMRGDSDVLGFMYDTIIFLKAGVNGIDRLYRGFTKDPNKRAIAAKVAMLAAMSAALGALNSDNPLYDDLEDWNRDGHWHFFVPKREYYDFVKREGREPKTKEEADPLYYHFKWPKIWEIGGVASIAERQWQGIAESIAQESGMPLWEAQKHTGRIIMDLFRLEYLPQAIAPLAEVYAYNRNRFTNRPVETEAMKDLQPWARAGPYTSEALRELGEATRHLPRPLQISPARAEALVRGYLNTWGMYGLSMVDAAAFDDKADMRFDRYPVVRRFFQQHPASRSRAVRELYDALREATEARRTMRQMDKSYRPEIAGELEQTPENLAYGQLTRANKRMRAVSREIGQVAWAKSLPAVQKLVENRARATRRPGLLLELHGKGAWSDIGALKAWLRDDLVGERNRYARSVVKDMAARKGKAGR